MSRPESSEPLNSEPLGDPGRREAVAVALGEFSSSGVMGSGNGSGGGLVFYEW